MKIQTIVARIANSERDQSTKSLSDQCMHIVEEVGELHKMGTSLAPGFDPNAVWYDHGHPEGFGIELADIILRCARVAAMYHVDLDKALEVKLNFKEDKAAAR